MKKISFLLIAVISLFGQDTSWIFQQITEDLLNLSENSIHIRDLQGFFNELDANNRQALYCSIYNQNIRWKGTQATDNVRNPHIFRYFEVLNKELSLPDVEFILLTDDGAGDISPLPLFSFSKQDASRNIVLFPDFEMLKEVLDSSQNWITTCQAHAQAHPWFTKEDRAFFRGGSTGGYNPSFTDFANDRVRVVMFSSMFPDLLDATLSSVFQGPIVNLLNSLNKPIQGVTIDTHFGYKYLLDVDGNASTYSRNRWILLSNSVLVKVMSIYSQWYYKAMQPGIHFLPVKNDLSDLFETLCFLKQNDHIANQIAENGTRLGKEIFSKEMVDLYVVLLLQEYKKKLHPFRQKFRMK